MKAFLLSKRLSSGVTALLAVAALTLGAFAIPSAFADEPPVPQPDAPTTAPLPLDLTQATIAPLPNTTYTGSAQTPAIKLTANNHALVEGVDYTLSYRNNCNAGTATITATGIGAYQGTKTTTFTIKPASISSAKAAVKTFTFTGNKPKVKVTVKALGKTIASNATKTTGTIKLIVPASAKKVGTHTIKVQGASNYTGTKTFTIKVKPKKTALTSVQGTSKSSISVKWKRPANDITGYEIRYSRNSDMTSAGKKSVGKASSSTSLSGLKAGTKYYLQVRAYKNVNGTKYVSDWSNKKSAKTKAVPKPKITSGTVYITNTGEKYHRGTCRYLRYSKYAISKSEAKSLGYVACKVCRP